MADPRITQPQMSRESRAMLLNILWHHQGGSSPVGQPLRRLLGIEQHAYLTDEEVAEAKWIDKALADGVRAHAQQPAQQSDEQIDALLDDLDEIAREHDSYEFGLPVLRTDDEDSPIHKMRAKVRQWLAAAPQQPAQQAVRMLTSDELYAALPTPRTPGEYIGTQNVAFTWDAWQAYVGAVERKFCEVNGIALPPAAKEGEKKQ